VVPSAPHQELFTSGAYLPMFQPDDPRNPFAGIYQAKRAMVLAAVPGVDRDVLDVGGGMGRMAIPLSKRHFVVLSDLSKPMLDRAQSAAGPRLRLVQADAGELPFPSSSFDYVLAIDLLPHLPRPDHALGEFHRVLRPNGTLIVDSTNAVPFWTLAYPRYLGRDPLRWLQTWRGGGVPPEWQGRVWHLRRRRFLTLLRDARFRVERIRGVGPRVSSKWHVAVATAV
jgi:ubiquinone/menaquinone biosynthesis C-methylase UbiE